jgi:hypothetical protein
MQRPIDARLDRVQGRRAAAAGRSAEAVESAHAVARAEVAIGAVIRAAMLQAGVDPACARRLALADEAAAELAAAGVAPGSRPAEPPEAPAVFDPARPPDRFEAKMLALAETFADGRRPDFAKASFAELFAWSLLQPAAEPGASVAPSPPDPTMIADPTMVE